MVEPDEEGAEEGPVALTDMFQVQSWIGFDAGQRPAVQLQLGDDLLDLNTIQEIDFTDLADITDLADSLHQMYYC